MDEQPDTAHPLSRDTLPLWHPSSSPLTSLSSLPPPTTEHAATPLMENSDGYESDTEAAETSPPRKRQKNYHSTTSLSVSVRATVIKKTGGKCWLCSLHGSQVAHVIPRSDRILVSRSSTSISLLTYWNCPPVQRLQSCRAPAHGEPRRYRKPPISMRWLSPYVRRSGAHVGFLAYQPRRLHIAGEIIPPGSRALRLNRDPTLSTRPMRRHNDTAPIRSISDSAELPARHLFPRSAR